MEKQHGIDDETAEEMFRILYAQSFPKTNNEPIFVSHSGKIFRQIRRPLDRTLHGINHIHFIKGSD